MKHFFWVFGIHLLFNACSGKRALDQISNPTEERRAIEITVLANLPDSLRPKVVFLNNVPEPSKILLFGLGSLQKNHIDGTGQA
ncbi:MAG: hypothetical protein ACI9UV_001775 [Algoriphagus sp.]|jgi:hypothetical protein|tara:strand:- start:316 stop:567 length:252 start_codon:yes stop_codon:yes gene_type:complete